jgi:putative N6-adenine-specific DNA methylase
MRQELIAPCHFGMESVLKREILKLGYEIVKVEDGKVTFAGEEDACARANMFLRTTERVLLKVGEFKAETFDELFEKTKAISWEEYLPADARFWVTKANSVKSKLFSPSDIQRIMKKAMVERMKTKYRQERFEETGADYPVRVSIVKDIVTLGIDTSGDSLHKRGYRRLTSKAPITETLAAALIMLTPWNKDRILVDPFCGCGTFPIEAAMLGANIAPGRKRSFQAEQWDMYPARLWENARQEADSLVRHDIEMNIQGYDIDRDIIGAARENAKLAGVDQYIHFQCRPLAELSSSKKYGFIITNPPYGERLEEKEMLPALYREMGQVFSALDSWSYYMITSYEDAEKQFGRKADKNRKIYNGMIKTYFYQFMGPKPPKKPQS